ncbi:MAG: bidirectional hydrogenase complex protein HoxU [Ferruginibacter sp.]
MVTISLTINGNKITATPGKTILEICREQNIPMLTLCHLKGIKDVGACRLCLVEIEGVNRLLSACTTKAMDNMIIRTDTDRIKKYQRLTSELLCAERNHVCSVCVANGSCELQDIGYATGMDHIRYPYLNPSCEVDASHPFFVIDHNRCIMCTRCVRVCAEVEGAFNWGVMNRGHEVRIISDFNTPWGESETCTSCGKCMHACPTGAIWSKSAAQGQLQKNPGMIEALMEKRKMNL